MNFQFKNVKWVCVCLFIMFMFVLSVRVSFAEGEAKMCKNKVAEQVRVITGLSDDKKREGKGYLVELENLLSTTTPVHLLVPEVKELLRTYKTELDGLCASVSLFDGLNGKEQRFRKLVYNLNDCAVDIQEKDKRQDILQFCVFKANEAYQMALDIVDVSLMRDAAADSTRNYVNVYRGLNSKIKGLLDEYNRMMDNFFTFMLRLGDTITGKSD
jgi:hypothetical protein